MNARSEKLIPMSSVDLPTTTKSALTSLSEDSLPQVIDDATGCDADRLTAIFYSLDKTGRAVLLDVAASLERNLLKE